MAEMPPMQKGTGKRLMRYLSIGVGRSVLGRHGVLHRHMMKEIGDRYHHHHQHQQYRNVWPSPHSRGSYHRNVVRARSQCPDPYGRGSLESDKM